MSRGISMEEVISLIYEIQKIIESQKVQNKESVYCLGAHGFMAWCRLEFRNLGAILFCASCD